MADYVKDFAPDTVITAILDGIKTQIGAFTPFFANLSEEDSGKRTMAEGREGYARLINGIATQHEENLSRNDDPAVLASRLDYDAALEKMRQGFMQLLEMVSDTQTANSIDIMQMVDRFNVVLQAGRSNNSALDQSMKEVDDWNKRFGTRLSTEDTAATV